MSKKAIVVASYGTSYPSTMGKTIVQIERDIEHEHQDCKVVRAFISKRVINKILQSTGYKIHTITECLEGLLHDGYNEVYVCPTMIIPGSEYHKLLDSILQYREQFDVLEMSTPLLDTSDDIEQIAELINSICDGNERAVTVLMGHGTGHESDEYYYKLQSVLNKYTYIATLEGDVKIGEIIDKLKANPNIEEVNLRPFMLVAGDHVNNDMLGDDYYSWKSQLERNGYRVSAVIEGLGEQEKIRQIYIRHLNEVMCF